MSYEGTVAVRHGTIKVAADTQKELFKEMASAYEVFNEQRCGLCGCKFIEMCVRKNKDEEDFYEYQCRGLVEGEPGKPKLPCRAYLYVGSNKKGGHLFPVRKLVEAGPEAGKPCREKGAFGRHNGWTRYRGQPKDGPR